MLRHVYRKSSTGEYWGKFRQSGRVRQVPLGTRDRQIARRKLDQLAEGCEAEQLGLPGRSAGLLLVNHLADFLASKRGLRRDSMYVYNLEHSLSRLFRECGWMRLGDLAAPRFEAWRAGQSALNPKTINDYLAALRHFCRWCMDQGRLGRDPFSKVSPLRREGVDSSVRALSRAEFGDLLGVAEDRALVYLLAAVTGLRRSEINALRVGDFHLSDLPPHVLVRASTTKDGRMIRLELPGDLVSPLRAQVERCGMGGAPFACPSMRIFRRDLAAAGIADGDSAGRRVVFHSLRHSCSTWLADMGVPPAVHAALMRHRDPRLSLKVYTDPARLEKSSWLNRLDFSHHLPRVSGPGVASADAAGRGREVAQKPVDIGGGRDLTLGDGDCLDLANNWGTRIRT